MTYIEDITAITTLTVILTRIHVSMSLKILITAIGLSNRVVLNLHCYSFDFSVLKCLGSIAIINVVAQGFKYIADLHFVIFIVIR
jgi:hypothetical protein